MGHCHFAHDCKIGNKNIFANNTLLAGHVVVEVSHVLKFCYYMKLLLIDYILLLSKPFPLQDYVHTSGAIAVHQFCHIGSHSFIGGGAMVCCFKPRFILLIAPNMLPINISNVAFFGRFLISYECQDIRQYFC